MWYCTLHSMEAYQNRVAQLPKRYHCIQLLPNGIRFYGATSAFSLAKYRVSPTARRYDIRLVAWTPAERESGPIMACHRPMRLTTTVSPPGSAMQLSITFSWIGSRPHRVRPLRLTMM